MGAIPEIPDQEAYEQVHDEALLAGMDADPIEEDPKEDPEEESVITEMGRENDEPRDEETRRMDIHMYPLPTPRSPSPALPPWNPLSYEGEDEGEMTPEVARLEDVPSDDPDTPPPPARRVVSLEHQELLVGHMSADLIASEARTDELRAQLVAEREMRYAIQGGVRFSSTSDAEREILRIELRARDQIRALPVMGGSFVSTKDAEQIYAASMMRVRDLTRPTDISW